MDEKNITDQLETPQDLGPRISIPIIRSYTLKESGLKVYRFPDPVQPEDLEFDTYRAESIYNFFQAMSEALNTPGFANQVKSCLALLVIENEDGGTQYAVQASVDDLLLWPNLISYLDKSGFQLARDAAYVGPISAPELIGD